ncbi:hypothetical protein AVEN_147400-1 [Araneus ventricosus]|uniref:Uncharacterized protein n=1 Tax=Araneus ventricosus TaxID=182803 RepID=A0A4Y2DN82_ARAVE|nr:hypothetical protein AVEN_147400-1 [Araneus ventricosus]
MHFKSDHFHAKTDRQWRNHSGSDMGRRLDIVPVAISITTFGLSMHKCGGSWYVCGWGLGLCLFNLKIEEGGSRGSESRMVHGMTFLNGSDRNGVVVE